MAKKQILLLLFLSIACSTFGQTDFETILRESDSIQIVSHSDLYKIIQTPRKSEKIYYDLLIEGKANPVVVKEQHTLDTVLKNELILLLTSQKRTAGYTEVYCFEPHHAILIFKNGQCRTIYICFGCRHFGASAALALNPEEFLHSDDDWQKLETFFKNQGIKYQMPKWKSN